MNKNIFAVIVAGGVGARMGNHDIPKQFMELHDRPVIVHTVGHFVSKSWFERILIMCPEDWREHTLKLCDEWFAEGKERITVLAGGASRNDTIMNAIYYIEREFGLDDDTVVVTHDAVRPFVTGRVIRENIDAVSETGACTTVIPATDTIVVSVDGAFIDETTDRSNMFLCQTPQTFKAKELKDYFEELSEEEKSVLTDATGIFSAHGKKVKIVKGEIYNIKLTYPYDMMIAETILYGR